MSMQAGGVEYEFVDEQGNPVDPKTLGGQMPSMMGGSAPITAPMQHDPSLVKWQLDSTDVLKELKHHLKNEYFDADKGQWVSGGDPLCNDKFLAALMPTLMTRVGKNTYLSNFERDDVNRLAFEARAEVIELLALRYAEFGIRQEHMTQIVNIIDSAIFAALRRPFEQGERVFLTKTHHETRQMVGQDRSNNSQSPPGLLGLFKK